MNDLEVIEVVSKMNRLEKLKYYMSYLKDQERMKKMIGMSYTIPFEYFKDPGRISQWTDDRGDERIMFPIESIYHKVRNKVL